MTYVLWVHDNSNWENLHFQIIFKGQDSKSKIYLKKKLSLINTYKLFFHFEKF